VGRVRYPLTFGKYAIPAALRAAERRPFLHAVATVAPGVLASLRDDVLPVPVPTYAEHSAEVARYVGEATETDMLCNPDLQPLWEALQAWSKAHHMDEPWVRVAGAQQLVAWRRYPDVATLPQLRRDPPYEPPQLAWLPPSYSFAHERRDTSETPVEGMEPHKPRSPEQHMEWVVRYQVLRQSYPDIHAHHAQRVLASGRREKVHTERWVWDKILATANLLGLTLTRRPRGGPRTTCGGHWH
jgi:hypothetical protein